MTIKILYAFTLSCIFSFSMQAQDTLNTRYGVFGHGLLGIHSANFPWLPETQSCCSGFTGSANVGLNAGVLLEFPLSDNFLVGTRCLFSNTPFSMMTREPINNIIVNGVGRNGAFEHKLFGSYSTVSVEPMVSQRLFETFFVHFGVSIGTIISSNYSQLQQITEPSGIGTFLDSNGNDSHKRTRNEFSGKLPNPSLIFSPIIGAVIEFPMDKKKTLLIVPELFFQLGITNVISDVNWKTNALFFGISLKYSPKNEPQINLPQIEKEIKKDTPTVISKVKTKVENKLPFVLSAKISAVGIDTNGTEVPNPILKVEEFTSTLMTSLLNYVFFEKNSSDIPTRYNRITFDQTTDFSPEKVNSSNKLRTYYQLLNIIGKRMQRYPTSNITLIGCTDEQDNEKGNLLLSKERAESVKKYLTLIWNISPLRISIQERLLPLKYSNSTTKDGAEENRRVEILSDNDNLLAPIITDDTLRTTSYPTIRFKTSVSYQSDITEWKITANQNSTILKQFSGRSNPPSYLDWQLSSENSSIPKLNLPVNYSIYLKDSAQSTVTSEGEFQLNLLSLSKKRSEKRGDKEIDLYSLMLFDVKSSELTLANKLSMQIIKNRIKKDASIVVMGYTDRLGEVNFNKSLAESRAKSVATYLGKSNSITTVAKGISNLYDNNLPEGRFYSRTVEIEVQTPVKY